MNLNPSPAAVAAREAVLDAIKPFQDALSGQEMLAIMAYTLGQLLAFQDQRTMTPDMGLEIIGKNIEKGNADAIEATLGNPQGRA